MLPDMHGTSVLADSTVFGQLLNYPTAWDFCFSRLDCFWLALELMHGTPVQPIVSEQSESESTEYIQPCLFSGIKGSVPRPVDKITIVKNSDRMNLTEGNSRSRSSIFADCAFFLNHLLIHLACCNGYQLVPLQQCQHASSHCWREPFQRWPTRFARSSTCRLSALFSRSA